MLSKMREMIVQNGYLFIRPIGPISPIRPIGPIGPIKLLYSADVQNVV